MGSFIALEVWVVLVAAPCIISWILGDMYGAARMRKLLDDTAQPRVPLTPSPKIAPLSASRQERVEQVAPADPGRLTIIRDPARAAMQTPANVPNRLEQERSRRRRETFEDMPPLAELQAQTQQIRQSDRVWESADLTLSSLAPDTVSTRVLEHYRGSIDELARHNSGLNRKSAQFMEDDLPRFSDAAPVQLDERMGSEPAVSRDSRRSHASQGGALSPDTQFI